MGNFNLGLVILFIVATIPLYGQGVDYALKPEKLNRKVDEWVNGQVTFNDGKTIQCEFSYNPLVPEGLLKIKERDKIIAYTVFDVESFTYHDNETSSEHTYFSFPVDNNNQVFVELLYEDSFYSILGRESILITKYVGYNNSSSSSVKTQYRRFLVDMETGQIYPLTLKILLRLMDDKKREIKRYIKVNHLELKDTRDCILVIKEYERLAK